MSMPRRVGFFLAILVVPCSVFAGDLTPPAGPVLPTPGPEPRTPIDAVHTPGDATALFIISQAGSYYLTGPVNGVSGKAGIRVAASNVTIDLMGYTLKGVAGSTDGITLPTSGILNTVIRNGTVSSWGQDGIDVQLGTEARIEDVAAFGNTSRGIQVGQTGVIVRCTASTNGSIGFFTSTACTISESTARINGGDGFSLGARSVIRGCTASANVGAGISLGTGAGAWQCTSSGSTAGSGIVTAAAAIIVGCNASGNALNGIDATSDCVIQGNICDSNGSAVADGSGIRITNTDNRIEGNNCTDNDIGIHVIASGNLIIRNSCSGNTGGNWDLVANNVYGTIVDRTAPASPAVTTDSAASTLGSTDANANWTY
ncbi:MAG TPA: right-handed parallel beta-helix repeat-containing protein [Phycisphaerales bacterium]|nr:right-handed parallel beta-helix repeat-containing protein [Phycisphaerales bacterium]